MRPASYKLACCALVFFFSWGPGAPARQAKHEKHEGRDKIVGNYDGGVFFGTDGSLPNGVCFLIQGRMSSGDFFNGLKRVETNQGTVFQRDAKTVKDFPDFVTVSFSIRDELCPTELQHIGTRKYMTQKMMDDMQLSIYWKHGVDL